ncbi:MAG: trans-sulfuration enzyme family protein [Flavobacteriales bacterium]
MSNITEILHSIPVDEQTGSISVPVYQTTTFVQQAPGVNKGFDYSRTANPTRKALENIIAKMEGGYASYAFATGLAAIDSVVKLLSAGDEIIAVDDIYGGAYRLFTHVYEKLGIKIHYVDTTDVKNITKYVNENTKFIWLESPTNPTLKITDIEEAAKIAKSVNALLIVDNTFASPVSQKPFDLGADIIIHSATKYLGGHSDLLAGVVVVKTAELAEKIHFIQNASGGVLAPWDCFLVIRGIETIDLRFKQQCQTAVEIANLLNNHPLIDKVHYPGLSNHKNHKIAAKQQNGLFGGIVSFSLKNDTSKEAELFLSKLKYFKLAESLGGVKSLVCQPSKMTHVSVPREKRLSSGIQDSLIRLSCGIENTIDLLNDIKQALN